MESESRPRRGKSDAVQTSRVASSSWSWWCCSHAPRGLHLAIVVLSWIVLTFMFCMPCPAKGQFIAGQSKIEDYSELNLCEGFVKSRSNSPGTSGDGNEVHMEERKKMQQLCAKGFRACFDSLCYSCTKSESKEYTKQAEENGLSSNDYEQEVQEASGSSNVKEPQTKSPQFLFKLLEGNFVVSCLLPVKGLSNKKISTAVMSPELSQTTVAERLLVPNVVLKPSVLEWEQTPLYSPSVLFLKVINNCNDSQIHVFKPFSTNSQFYAHNFDEATIAPGKILQIPFVFLPERLGLAVGHIVLQTSLGGFLVQAKGIGIDSPFRVSSMTGLSAFSGAVFQNNISLYNPSEGLLIVEEALLWIAEAENISEQPFSALCRKDIASNINNHDIPLHYDSWLNFGTDARGVPLFGFKPVGEWKVNSHTKSTIMEFDISIHREGNLSGTLCTVLRNSLQNMKQTLILPFNIHILKNPGKDSRIYPSFRKLESSVISDRGWTTRGALSLENDGSEILRIEEIMARPENEEHLQIYFLKGLVLFPGTSTHVAMLVYRRVERSCEDYNSEEYGISPDCHLIVVTNSTNIPQLEIQCQTLIQYNLNLQSAAFESPGSEVKHSPSIKFNNQGSLQEAQNDNEVSYPLSISSPKGSPLEFKTKADEMFISNWKSHGATENISVLVQRDLIYSLTQIGTNMSKWIDVINPTEHLVAMQLFLSLESVPVACKHYTESLEIRDPMPSYLTSVGQSSVAFNDEHHVKKAFYLPENGLTEAILLPHKRASFGPIFFQPLQSCVWTSLAYIRNNLSGVEWLHLEGAGSNFSLTFYEGPKQINELNFVIPQTSVFSYIGFMKFYSNVIFDKVRFNALCITCLQKNITAKNTGDVTFESKVINIGGKACVSNGFRAHTCHGFSVAPGDSIELLVSYEGKLSASVIHEELQILLPSGDILRLPLHARVPDYVIALCQKSFSELIVKKAIVLMVISALAFAVFLWCRRSHETAYLQINHLYQSRKIAISQVPKANRGVHDGQVKERSASVSRIQQLSVSSARSKASKQQHAGFLKEKLAQNFVEDKQNGSNNGQENNYLDSVSGYEHLKCLNDYEKRNSAKTMEKSQSTEISQFSSKPQRQKPYLTTQVGPTSFSGSAKLTVDFRTKDFQDEQTKYIPDKFQDEQTKYLHDKKTKGDVHSRHQRSPDQSSTEPSVTVQWPPESNSIPLKSIGITKVSSDSSSTSTSQVVPLSGQLTVKVEKEKGRRKKKRSSKQDLLGSQSGHSTPSSPASPITPVASSNPISPLVKMSLQSSCLLNDAGDSDWKHQELMRSQITGSYVPDKSHGNIADVPTRSGWDEQDHKHCSDQQNTINLQAKSFHHVSLCADKTPRQKMSRELASAGRDWVAVAKKPPGWTFSHSTKSDASSSSKKLKPLLTASATFPQRRRCEVNPESNYMPCADAKQSALHSSSSPSLLSKSSIAPHARAPGTKLKKSNSVKSGECNPNPAEQDFTYDIWGNHFSGLSLTSTNSSALSIVLPNADALPRSQDYCHSFFAGFNPQTNHENATKAGDYPYSLNQPESVSFPPPSVIN